MYFDMQKYILLDKNYCFLVICCISYHLLIITLLWWAKNLAGVQRYPLGGACQTTGASQGQLMGVPGWYRSSLFLFQYPSLWGEMMHKLDTKKKILQYSMMNIASPSNYMYDI